MWSGGAALDIKLAADTADGITSPGKGKTIIQLVGDGTFLFSVPSTVYWISHRYRIPVLTIILNNKGMFQTVSAISSTSFCCDEIKGDKEKEKEE